VKTINERRKYRPVESVCSCRHILIALLILLSAGCGARPRVVRIPEAVAPRDRLASVGYAIQVGAFSHLNNAVRLEKSLRNRGLNAYYFAHDSGLYKVRFGNFPTKDSARREAEALLSREIIGEFYVVGPEDYPLLKDREKAGIELRNEIVKTAKRYIGMPYRWGGTSPTHGFDCSGLSMVVYRLNGLNLPRTSRQQWAAGHPVNRRQLSKADLVFFDTTRGGKVSHVGICLGGGRFIHAPGPGKTIRVDSFSSGYYRRRYIGARTYL
jgi:hypothetical protein